MSPPSRPTHPSTDLLAVIPARSGSKRIPNKNLRSFGGKPLVLWTIEAARQSRSLSHVLVSTDSEAIADVARAAGLDVPFLRPSHLATDTTPMVDVIQHAVQWAERGGRRVSAVATLQPTSPLRIADDIEAAIASYRSDPGRAVVSVALASPRPEFWVRIDGDALVPLSGFWPQARSQDLPPAYALNGAIFITPRAVLEAGDLVGDRPRAHIMPRERSIDIDDESDWRIAEALVR